jgi:hypothetical protein
LKNQGPGAPCEKIIHRPAATRERFVNKFSCEVSRAGFTCRINQAAGTGAEAGFLPAAFLRFR